MSDRIRLLNVLTNYRIGGTERQVTNVALGIDSSRFDLHLACLRNEGELRHELEQLDIPRPEFKISSLYGPSTMRQALRMASYIKRNLIQIVHSYGFYANVFTVPAARIARKSVIITSIRDTGDILTPKQRLVQKLVCKMADCVLVNAEAIRKTLIAEGYRRDNIVIIRNGIVLSRFEKGLRNGVLRSSLGIPEDARIVLVSSRLNHMKGIEYFLDAAVIVSERARDVRFLVVGDGVTRPQLEDRVRRSGLASTVLFTGFRTDVPDLLSESTISVLPSLSEGLSNSLLESMAAGVPVVATRVGGNPEIIQHGMTGLLVPPRDPVALADAMSKLLSDSHLAACLSRAARQHVEEQYSMRRSIQEVECLYRHLVESQRWA